MQQLYATPNLADRVEVRFTCPAEHTFAKVFASDVKAPRAWDCPRCGKNAVAGLQAPPDDETGLGRTHWDMVLERRTLAELDQILARQLGRLRGR